MTDDATAALEILTAFMVNGTNWFEPLDGNRIKLDGIVTLTPEHMQLARRLAEQHSHARAAVYRQAFRDAGDDPALRRQAEWLRPDTEPPPRSDTE